MDINISKLGVEQLDDLQEVASRRAAELREAQAALGEAHAKLGTALGNRTDLRAEIHLLRAEIERLENIIKPKRRRKRAEGGAP